MFARGRAWMLGFIIFCLGPPCAARATPTVYVEPTVSAVDPGDTVEVQVMVNAGADSLSSFDIFFRFDPDIIEFLYPAVEGSLFVNAAETTFTWFEPGREDSIGKWEVFDVLFPGDSYVLAPGELCRLRFLALAQGTSQIEIVEVWLTDRQRNYILPVVAEGGWVHVGDGSGIGQDDSNSKDFDVGFPFPSPTHGKVSIPLILRQGGEPVIRWPVTIYDAEGRLVATIDCSDLSTNHCLVWDGRNHLGEDVSPGVYFLEVATRRRVISRRVVVIH